VLPDGRVMFVAYNQGSSNIYEVRDGQVLRRTDIVTGLFDVNPGPDGGVWALFQHSGDRAPVLIKADDLLTAEEVTQAPAEAPRTLARTELTGAQRDFQATKMEIHAAMVDRMDQEIGRVLAKLKAMGAFENTLILFASDNGASAEIMVRGDGHDLSAPMGSAATFLCLGPGWSSASNTPFRRHKTWVHEGGIATPLIAHWPQGIDARGELRRTQSHLIAIVPTILQLTVGEHPLASHGRRVAARPDRRRHTLRRRRGAGVAMVGLRDR
jgi:arylsulfatase A-like enzyme